MKSTKDFLIWLNEECPGIFLYLSLFAVVALLSAVKLIKIAIDTFGG